MIVNNFIDPFDDSELKYDFDRHEYYGTNTLLLNNGIDLHKELDTFGVTNIETLANRFIRRASKRVYQYIYNHCGVNGVQLRQFLMAKVPHLRNMIKDWIVLQTEYMVVNGMINLEGGINFKTGKMVDHNNLRGSRAYSSEMIDDMRRIGMLDTNFHAIIADISYGKNNY